MSLHLQREMSRLKQEVTALGTLVEENLRRAIEAVLRRDAARADEVEAGDTPIDLYEVDLEEECLKALALYQPVAADLRFVVAVLKLNNDLERIGDKAVKLARRAEQLAGLPTEAPDYRPMAACVRRMLKGALDALVHQDAALARSVCAMDDAMDALNRAHFETIRRGLQAHPEALSGWLAALAVSRAFERIADHCTNIAEDVIYMIEGHIVRHDVHRAEADAAPAEPASVSRGAPPSDRQPPSVLQQPKPQE